MQTFLSFFITLAGPVAAHEVRPAIAELNVTAQGATLHLSLNIEALLAGIDLDDVLNTDKSTQSVDYDSLRRAAPELLQEQVKAFFPMSYRLPSPIRKGVSLNTCPPLSLCDRISS